MKPVQNYILLVDSHKPPHLRHRTAGRYRVGAKSEKEAVRLLRATIGFGSINVYYQCPPDDIRLGYKAVKQEIPQCANGSCIFLFQEPIHATAPRNP